MLKRLLALFKRKPSSQKTFEEKLEKLNEPVRQRDPGFAKDERSVRMHRSLHPGHQPSLGPSKVAPPPKRRQVEAPARRGMTRNASAESRMRNDDAFLQSLMVQSMINNTTSHRLPDVDTCQTPTHTPYHTPSGGYDTTPSDSGGSFDGGGSCD
ncbi:hypothetical protein pEaSNUABM35_00050 [Erwinia phage pEa_SNUABM_35]|uniref:Uncharacterized protein n=1 Tax=Erwinia phage pEa_SNUABM_35 TaxID=2869557 RepID=A0AAE8C200_9CAUD|nr:hypothetical protein MPK65_gp050 [Erwinia phage pEa_SNUABM_35]QZE59967.1 hypothetical protein pEaSNUABM35_00050 [Erwinia phage pEa_SNUABM_35]QZE60303.1 hypothetical protein pEaSNUABM36_00050 [Erwinia phage pEa_SNUABM_36]